MSANNDELQHLIDQRRSALDQPAQPQHSGLALSGGGIRSSVFCYGLISALASAKTLWRFDLMSTVSGGGYIGSMVGRLAQQAGSASELQRQLGEQGATAHHRSWLRANSRYLTPRGSRDRLYAVVIFLRNLAGVHLELAFIGLLLGSLLGLVDILAWWAMGTWVDSGGNTALSGWTWVSRLPTLWLLLPIIVVWALISAALYWYMPTGTGDPADWDKRSLRVTQSLAMAFRVGMVLILLGVVDWIAWRWAAHPQRLIPLATLFASLLAVLRLLMPAVQQNGKTSGEFLRQKLPAILDWAGRFGLLILGIFWVAVVHAFATRSVWDGLRVDYLGAALALLPALLISALLMGLSGRNLDFLNRSSLHNFYRSRLTRAFLGAANARREAGNPAGVKVTEVDSADDIPLHLYTPHTSGGPVHILNVCVNQTYQRQGLYNIDRQGDLMSVVGSGRFQLRDSAWQKISKANRRTLGTWMAISGAAAGPGLGTLTRPGLAAMLTTLGVRLGYWCKTGHQSLRWYEKYMPKYTGLVSEVIGRFAGVTSNIQYLSDGGHSENTGAYPLLKARCKMIVLADAAADPEYQFGDLENLIRRARIDLHIDIRFILPASNQDALFGSIDDLVSPDSSACLAIARVDFPDDPEPGVLILVKPNLTPGLPEDVYNYSRDYPAFPQEPTIDQFFDEAQWESYFTLGCHLGSVLTESRLLALQQAPQGSSLIARAPQSSSPLRSAPAPLPASDADAPASKRRPKRIMSKSTAAAGIGLGAILTSATGLLAGISPGKDEVQFDLSPLYQGYGVLPTAVAGDGRAERAVATLAARIMQALRTLGEDDAKSLLINNSEALDMLRTTYRLCGQLKTQYEACRMLIESFECPTRPETSPVSLNDGYWARRDGSELRQARRDTFCESDTEGVPAVAAPPGTPGAAAPPVCAGITVFTQVYGPQGRDNARTLRALWRAAGAQVPPIEDVVATARAQGRSAPSPYDKATVIYHKDDAKACAQALAGLAYQPSGDWVVSAMSERLARQARTVEVWLPPSAVAAGLAHWGQSPIAP